MLRPLPPICLRSTPLKRHQRSAAIDSPILQRLLLSCLTALVTSAPLLARPAPAITRSVSPFCKLLSSVSDPYGKPQDRAALERAIAQRGDLNQPCLIFSNQPVLPLHYLLETGQEQLVQQLIDQGINVQVKDRNGNTALHALRSSEKNGRSLIQKGVPVNAKDSDFGNTSLHEVYNNRTAAVTSLLLENGAQVDARNLEQKTPLYLAAEIGKAEIVEVLIRNGADVNARSSNNSTPLHAGTGDVAVTRLLLQAGANPTLQSDAGGAPIHSPNLAPATLKLMLAKGVDVNLRNREGQTPLQVHSRPPYMNAAAQSEIIQILLANGAQVDAQDAQGKTALHEANFKSAQQLIAANANLNIQDLEGSTILHYMALRPELAADFVPLLLSKQARTDLKDNQGRTVLDLARQKYSNSVVNWLERHILTQADPVGSAKLSDLQLQLAYLQQQLNAKTWATADEETRRLLTPLWDSGTSTSLSSAHHLALIRGIDQAWLKASGGRFGLSVQVKLWREALAKHPNNNEAAVHAFRDRVGWKLSKPRPAEDFISSDWLNEAELNRSLQAPVGHLPWAGVSDRQISELLAQDLGGGSCGSCTIDAIFLRNNRFYSHLPALFSQVQIALETPAITISDWRSPQLLHRINLAALYPSNSGSISPITTAISPNSNLLAVASRSQPSAQVSISTLALWNLERGTRLVTLLKPGTSPAQAIAFSRDSQRIAAVLANGQAQVWDTTTGESSGSWQAHGDRPNALALSPNGQWLVSGSGDPMVKVWDINSGKLLKTLSLSAGEAQASAVQGLQISPDSTRLAIATDRTIQLWDLPNGKLLKVAFVRSPLVAKTLGANLSQSMAFSPDGQRLATLDLDNSIKLWNANSGARILTLRPHQRPVEAIAFSPDGQTLLSRYDDQRVLFWNLKTDKSDRSISIKSGNRPNPKVDLRESRATQQPILLSPDSKTFAIPIAAISLPGTTVPGSGFALDVRDGATGIHLASLDNVQQAHFSPDNRILVTQGQEVQVWRP
jgi:uncharacterized protein